jgi:hypothetical protein
VTAITRDTAMAVFRISFGETGVSVRPNSAIKKAAYWAAF